MKYTQLENCTRWQFEKIPPFEKGNMFPFFVNGGTGFTDDFDAPAADSTFVHSFFETEKSDIEEYADLLCKNGFEKIYENEIAGNLFYQFSVPEGLYYVSYLSGSKIARFILDRCESAGLDKFGYDKYEDLRGNTVFAQYSLHYDKMIKGTTCDCGMNYVFRLRDNSLIIIDGGEIEQSTDAAAADYLKFLHELSNTADGEKMTVSLWVCTHSHNDHMDLFTKLLRVAADELEVKRAVFNFPSPVNYRISESVKLLKARLAGCCPAAGYVKAHAGSKFRIANADITVLLSSEDNIGMDEEDVFSGLNCTSLAFTVEAEGKKVLFLADMGDANGNVFIKNYPKDFLASDFLQAAHHGINKIYDVYEALETKTVLLPQCRMNMETRFSDIFAHLIERFEEENICLAQDRTDIFTLDNGTCLRSERAHFGSPYDGSAL